MTKPQQAWMSLPMESKPVWILIYLFMDLLRALKTMILKQENLVLPHMINAGKIISWENWWLPDGLGAVAEFLRLKKLAPAGPTLKASVPGPYTLSGRLLPNNTYQDRYAITEALLPIISKELEALVAVGCMEITVDEPSMSCYAYKEDTKRYVDIFNRTVKAIAGKCNLSTHLCFGNFKGRPVGYRSIKPMLPDFLDLNVNEIHIEMANREFSEIELLKTFAEKMNVAVGIIDVKNYYIETVDDVVERINRCLKYIPAEKLSVAPDCGLSQTARWASKQKLVNMVKGAKKVRENL